MKAKSAGVLTLKKVKLRALQNINIILTSNDQAQKDVAMESMLTYLDSVEELMMQIILLQQVTKKLRR